MELLITLGVGVLVGALFLGARAMAAARRRAGFRAGRTVCCRAALGFGHTKARRGRLFVSARRAGWGRWRRASWVELTGGQVTTATTTEDGDVALRITLPDGRTPQVVLPQSDAALLTRTLAGDETPEERPGRLLARRWHLVFYALVALWIVTWAVLVVGGDTVHATVTTNDDDGTCDVVWTDTDGNGHGAEIDCDDEKPGETRTIWTLVPPLQGDAVDVVWTIAGVGVIAGIGLLPAIAGSALNFRDRRMLKAAPTPVPAPAVAQPPALTEEDLRPTAGETPTAYLARLAPHAARQARPHDWLDPKSPRGARIKPPPRAVAALFIGPFFVLLTVSQFTVRPWLEDGHAPRFWLVIALVGGGVAVAWAGYRIVDVIRTYRLLSRQVTVPPRAAIGLITSDPEGDPVLLTCDPIVVPPVLYAIGLRAPLPATEDSVLQLRAHGRLAEDEPVVAELADGAFLLPTAPAVPADIEMLHVLLDPVAALRAEQ